MTIILQILAAFLVGVGYYMLAMGMTVYDGMISLILQPIMGGMFAIIAIIILLVVGLPIRLMKKVNLWWKHHWWLSFILGAVAFVMMYASWMPQFRIKVLDPDSGSQVDSFHPLISISGWMLTIFSVLYFYPPLPWLEPKHFKAGRTADGKRPESPHSTN